jgi:hypothetical protein
MLLHFSSTSLILCRKLTVVYCESYSKNIQRLCHEHVWFISVIASDTWSPVCFIWLNNFMGFLNIFENFLLISFEKYFHYFPFSMPFLIRALDKTVKVDTHFIGKVKTNSLGNIQRSLILKELVYIQFHGVKFFYVEFPLYSFRLYIAAYKYRSQFLLNI